MSNTTPLANGLIGQRWLRRRFCHSLPSKVEKQNPGVPSQPDMTFGSSQSVPYAPSYSSSHALVPVVKDTVWVEVSFDRWVDARRDVCSNAVMHVRPKVE
jgi:hypothetical protein